MIVSQLIIAITIATTATTKLTDQSGFHFVCIFCRGISDILYLVSLPEKSEEICLDLAIKIYLLSVANLFKSILR